MDELADIKCQRDSVSYTIVAMYRSMEKYRFKAEDKGGLSILSKGNAIQKTVAEKQKLVKSLDSTSAKLEKECKAVQFAIELLYLFMLSFVRN